MPISYINTGESYTADFWYLYIDISLPLHPRYVFIQGSDFYNCTHRTSSPLRLVNAQDHAVRYLIPDVEEDSLGTDFGEAPQERHRVGISPKGKRRTNKKRLSTDPEYASFIESRKARAREHPAVVRMKQFAWLRKSDVLKPDGTALLQQVWLRYGSEESDIIT